MGKSLLWGRNAKERLIRLVVLLVIAGVIRFWVMMPVFIQGISMVPTCRDGQLGAVNKLAYLFRAPQRGDLVCVWTGKEFYIKRIIGLPGEEIGMRNGVLYVQGQPCRESYLKVKCQWNVEAGKLGVGTYAVVGDNRAMAQHLAVLAVVKKERIVGKVMLF